MTLAPGATIGSYRIEGLLGRGGMGEVYRATDPRLDRPVALKLVAPELAAAPGIGERFLAESRLAASLDHPNIVPIYEAGEADGRLFLAMRFVDGADLGAVLAAEGRLEPARAVRLLRGIADALDAAHDRGLVHRDVKPGNVLIARSGRGDEHAYLADFGLVKQLGSGGGLTQSGQLLGSVDYVAPEQIEGLAIDARVDVYSLACVLYAALTGEVPYPRDSDMATLWAHVQTPAPRPSAVDPAFAPFDALIARGMAKDPADRPASAGELLREVEAVAATGSASMAEPARPPTVRLRVGQVGPVVAGVATIGLAALLIGMLTRPEWPFTTPSLSPNVGIPAQSTSTSPQPAAADSGVPADNQLITLPSREPGQPLEVPLDAGTYTFDQFDPRVTFTVDEGWVAYRDYRDAAGIFLTDGQPSAEPPFPYLGGIDFARVQVVSGPCVDDPTILLESDPAAFIDWLSEHPGLEAGDVLPVNLGGYSGLTIDISVDTDTCEADGPSNWLFPVGDDFFRMHPGEMARITTLDIDGRPVSVIVSGSTSDDFYRNAEGVLTTLRFRP